MNYEEALAFVHGRPRLRKVPTLKRMRQFLTELGNPQTKIQAVHVAGTNGKGSTIAFLTSLLGQEGRQVGTFTSPFITMPSANTKFTSVMPIKPRKVSSKQRQLYKGAIIPAF